LDVIPKSTFYPYAFSIGDICDYNYNFLMYWIIVCLQYVTQWWYSMWYWKRFSRQKRMYQHFKF